MSQTLIFLSLLPIIFVGIARIFNVNRFLVPIIPISIYLIILSLLLIEFDIKEISFAFLNIGDNTIHLVFSFMSSNTLMSEVVLLISILVLLYSYKFIDSEENKSFARYFLYLTIFISSMILFTFSYDLFSSFVFWEILGFSSYFLIGFWNKDTETIKSSTIAFWVTRFGDLFFLGGIVIIFSITGTLNINEINKTNSNLDIPLLLIVIGVFSKSAQFPFNIWLPKAMKGPTPVSSLIHSATMVVAGVLLIYKIYPAIEITQTSLTFLLFIGIFSSVVGSIAAFFENDLKKILAFSTISHIGIMFLAIGIKRPDLGYFHMFSHSFFKSLLFLYAGVIISLAGSSNLKDLRNSVNLKSMMGIILIIACFSLSSIYFFTGSYSKEFIVFSLVNQKMYVIAAIMLIGVIFTTLYTAKILFTLINFKGENASSLKLNKYFIIPLFILSIFAFLGPLTMELFQKSIILEYTPHTMKNIILLQVFVISIYVIYLKYNTKIYENLSFFNSVSDTFFKTDHIFREIYESIFKSSSIFIGWLDRNLVDGFINYIPSKIIIISNNLKKLQSGFSKSYALRTIIFFILFILAMNIIDNFLIIGELK